MAATKVGMRERLRNPRALPLIDTDDEGIDFTAYCDGSGDYCLLQVYKIRRTDPSSLVVHRLGMWSEVNTTSVTKIFLSIEKRTNFYKFPLMIAHRNATRVVTPEEPLLEYDEFDGSLLEFYTYFVGFLNASEHETTFAKIGQKTPDGEWTDLLGALVREEIDVGFECFIKIASRYDDMSFTHDIMKTMKNVYVQPEASDAFRNIYLKPFDRRLILCVMGTGILFSVCLTITNKLARLCNRNLGRPTYGIVGGLVWCVGVFCQQGSIWKPTMYADQIIILIALAFTLLMYNSYSAFITSVLSVTLADIRTVEDLLDSDYAIGYTRNGVDEAYLRTTNASQLNQIYLRGFLANVRDVAEGLSLVTAGGYGFFSSGEQARKALLNVSHHRCRYDIQEIPIKYTVNSVSFALSKRSPYKHLINLSVIRMYETGIHKYINNLLYPALLPCDKPKTYQSARFSDISSAFSLLFLGYLFGVILLLVERAWKDRKSLLRSCYRKKGKENFNGYIP